MSDLDATVESLRDDIAATQALIDQAETHFERNKHLFSPAMQRNFRRELMMRKMKLGVLKTQTNRIFPR